MTAAPNAEDRWLDDLLSAPPAALPDGGFTARVMTRMRRRRLVRPAILGSLGLVGLLIALRFASLSAMAGLLPGEKLWRVFDALPAINVSPAFDALPAIDAVNFTNPAVMALLAAALLIWLVQEMA